MDTWTDTEIAILDTIVENAPRDRWLSLTDIRPRLARWTRADQDRVLWKMNLLDNITLVPESNQKTLRPADWDAAVEIGGQYKHCIWIGE
ncbi:hypothetical protein ACIBQ6_21940 [Nonomuraea sp. NPDC049655]|uniref:hypothetical protein n=1 Tax=Nonomuraea sp. NPDC049655 TaxID=3364355 RepID=UPI0037AECE47